MPSKASKPKPDTSVKKTTSQARIELPFAKMNFVREAAGKLELPLTAFIRLAVLEKAKAINEGK
jgi:hypothetical protein